MPSFARQILEFNESLDLDESLLPRNISVMNPFRGEHSQTVWQATRQFYRRFYDDNESRAYILGINPGRFGAGSTGIPFTDTKRLQEECGISLPLHPTHEPSSVFVYQVVQAYGGPAVFYRNFYINSICPLGFVRYNEKGNRVNFNYYDDMDLQEAVTPFIVDCMERQMRFGARRKRCFCMGSGKNHRFLNHLNKKHGWFEEVIPLEHPRFVVQYRSRRMGEYVKKYLDALGAAR